ncbi:MAG: hypothetical protein QT03_C0001G0911 [archaeon GW2011_AR10]|uniref:30S ribosomal protein S30 n=1 Tax=Candidatus Iainarchaeum sp. TaxID=3101447 RepID=A0A7J4IU77_9ARCH|nr:MAG: hypothetical protein QT03_C0001G0911 [archaeon GW2011_AR10]HIH08380.1 hypothetical protein [Candidatus Diapherotrites archaeon]
MGKVNQKEFIKFVGIKEEDSFERSQAIAEGEKTFLKLKPIIKSETNLKVHVKAFEVEGRRKKYSVTSMLRSPDHFFEAKSEKWAFLEAVRDSLKTLELTVKRKMKR